MGLKFNPLIFAGFDNTGSGGGGSSPSIGGPVTGGLDTSVLFIHPNGTLSQDPTNFNYNSTTHALTITGPLSASNFSGSSSGTNTGDQTITLTGDVTGSGTGSFATTVVTVGGSTASNVHSAELLANAATASNTINTIVKRDGSGNFNAGSITASLIGHASLDLALTGGTLSGVLDLGGNLISNVADPVSAQDAVTLAYSSAQFANRDLGNLTITAINVDLNPASPRDLGSSTPWRQIYASQGFFIDQTTLATAQAYPSGATGSGINTSSISTPIGIFSANGAGSADIRLETGNASATSGSIVLQTGTGTSRGSISLNGSSINANSTQINNVVDPTSAQDAATKNYVDSVTSHSPGDITQTSFTAADNQSSPANVTGFVFSNVTVRSFEALVSIVRNNTYSTYTLNGIQKASSWEMSQASTGDVTGVTFSITAAGQVQYQTTSTGFTALVKFRAMVTSV